MRKSRVSIENWKERCNKKHNNKYDYSKVNFSHLSDIITIICPKHGEFNKVASLHLKSGCLRCSNNRKFHIDDVKELLSTNKFFDILPFSNYLGNRQKINVLCKDKGHISIKSIHHLLSNNVNCSICSKKYKQNKEEWIEMCNNVHNNKYNYFLADYVNVNSKVNIICPIHGEFRQLAFSHKNGSGCRKCNKSIGENIISEILHKHKIRNEEQKTFSNLKYKSNLYFDFYLPEYNLCIEFDGLQHSKAYYFFGGEDGLNERIKRDEMKNKYCIENSIRLLRISYSINYKTKNRIYSKIEEKIVNELNEI